MDLQKIRELRSRHKSKLPTFRGSFGSKRRRKIKNPKWNKWRKPRGLDSDLRRKYKNEGRHPGIGYRKPKAVRNLHPSGLREVYIRNLSDLENAFKKHGKNFIARIAKAVGKRKRLEMQKLAEKEKIRIANIGKKPLLSLKPEEKTKKITEIPAEAKEEKENAEKKKPEHQKEAKIEKIEKTSREHGKKEKRVKKK
jgi:large subunit ribosomal protein L32e